MIRLVRCILLIVLVAESFQAISLANDDPAIYSNKIKPLLRDRCYSCHGAMKQKAGLRLDTVRSMLQGGDSGAVIVPNESGSSVILGRVSANDIAERMPPEHEGEPLSAEQVELIRTWIDSGAPAPSDEQPETDPREHWAFQPVRRPLVPMVANLWTTNPIDAFLAEQHERHGLKPQREPDRLLLVRRLFLDLIGIPPTLDEIEDVEADTAPDWYERIVDRLLNDPRHGERWARHWMDIWRYSDSWGLGDQLRNSQPHIWHWRDWIIESLNEDLPYDEMVRSMLAADELHPQDLGKLRATGFLARNYFLFNRNQWMDEAVEHVSKGFLGLTINCAKCHSHKYDPIEQTDYYRLRAIFEPYHVRIDVVSGEPNLTRDGIPRVYDGLLDTPTYRFVRGQENSPDKSVVMTPGVPELLQFKDFVVAPVSLPTDAWQPEQRPWVIAAHISAARNKVLAAEAGLGAAREKKVAPEELTIAELALSVAKVELISTDRRAEAVRAAWARAGASTILSRIESDHKFHEHAKAAVRSEREAAVARAKHVVAEVELRLQRSTDEQRPNIEKELTAAREELEKTTMKVSEPGEEFTSFVGAAWTPTRFISSTTDDPTVTFPSTSSGRRTALADWITNRRNPLTARVAVNHVWMRHMGAPLVPTVFDFGRKGQPPTHPELLDWLASEFVDSGWRLKCLHRAIVASSAYRMGSSVAGASLSAAKDPDNRFWWRRVPVRLESQVIRDSLLALAGTLDLRLGGPSVPPASQADSRRRSLYFFHSNNDRNQFLTTFDEALVKECYRREQSIVPQQALALTNSQLVLDASSQIAKLLLVDDDRPSSSMRDDDDQFVRRAFRLMLGITPSDAETEASVEAIRLWRLEPDATPDQARSRFVWALLNHGDFVTLR